MTPALATDALAVSGPDGPLVRPITLAAAPGTALTILGETGAGKSLLAQAILGALPPGLTATGRVFLDGQRLDTLPTSARRALWGRRIAMLPQEPWRALDPTMRALSQVTETHAHVAGLPRAAARAAATSDFAALRLTGAEARLPSELSGGMAQRVAFAAARAGGAALLLADEPTKGLDPALRDEVARLLARAVAAGDTLLTITHDVALARALGGTVLLMRAGAIVEEGPATDLLARPRSAYGRALVAADPAHWPQRAASAPGAPVLTAHALAAGRAGAPLVTGLDLTLRRGERLALTGPSGAGKSTLLDTLAGLLPPLAGRVERAPTLGPHAIQKLYQDPPAAFPPRIPLGTTLHDLAARHAIPWPRIEDLLARLGLAPALLARRPDAVSGGELQRLALARILAMRPAAILADEPTSRLDLLTQAKVLALLGEEADATGTAVLLVTHSSEIAARWAYRTLALEAGTAQAESRAVPLSA
jgi:ABC-type glutathione transport system ATPase component